MVSNDTVKIALKTFLTVHSKRKLFDLEAAVLLLRFFFFFFFSVLADFLNNLHRMG